MPRWRWLVMLVGSVVGVACTTRHLASSPAEAVAEGAGVVRLDPATGALSWSAPLEPDVVTSVVVHHETVVVSGTTNRASGTVGCGHQANPVVIAFDVGTGRPRWTRTSASATAAPEDRVGDSDVVVLNTTAIDGTAELVAVGADDGRQRWRASGRILAQDANLLLLAGTDRFEGRRRSDGTVVWTAPPGGPVSDAAMSADGGTVIVAGPSRGVYAFEAGSGALRWHLLPLFSAAGPAGGEVLAMRVDVDRLAGFDVAAGQQRWEVPLAVRARTSPAGSAHTLVSADRAGHVRMLDNATGAVAWERNDAQHAGTSAASDFVGIRTADAAVALDVARGVERWATTLPEELNHIVSTGQGGMFVAASHPLTNCP